MRGLEYNITRAAAEMVQCLQAPAQLHPPPPPYSLCITRFLSISLSLLHCLLPLSHMYLSISWPFTSVLNYTSFFGSLYRCAPSLCFKLFVYSASYSQNSFYASTTRQCLYTCPDFAYITLDTKHSSPVFSLPALLFFKDDVSLSQLGSYFVSLPPSYVSDYNTEVKLIAEIWE